MSDPARTDETQPKKPRNKVWRWLRWPVYLLVGFTVLGMLLDACGYGDTADDAASPTPTVSAEPTPEESPEPTEAETTEPAAEPTPEEASEPTPEEAAGVTADEANTALREALGLFGDDSYQSLPADTWGFYVVDVQVPVSDLIRVTLQVDRSNAGDREIVDGSSRAIFSLIGQQFPGVQTVEVVDGAGTHIEQTHRRDVPLLNR